MLILYNIFITLLDMKKIICKIDSYKSKFL